MTVRIVTDSASDLTPGEAEALGVDIVPLSIRFGEEVFLDRDPEIFAQLLRLMRQHPHVAGLLPHEPRLCASLIAEADFFVRHTRSLD